MSTLEKIEPLDFYDIEGKKELIKKTVCVGATDNELELFLHTCKKVGLDPLMKQIYSIKRGGQRTIQTGIDGFRLIAERTGAYAPGREPSYIYNQKNEVVSATAYVKKRTSDGTWHEVSATAFFDEYFVTNNSVWKEKPHIMISKCAEALAIRKAFPANLSGVYSYDEMAQVKTTEALPTIEVCVEELGKKDLEELAEEVALVLVNFEGKSLCVSSKESLEFLVAWKEVCSGSKKPLTAETIKGFIDKPERLVKAFENWREKKKPLQT